MRILRGLILVCLVGSIYAVAAPLTLFGSFSASGAMPDQQISAPFDVGDVGLGGQTLPGTVFGVTLTFAVSNASVTGASGINVSSIEFGVQGNLGGSGSFFASGPN